MSNTVAKPIHLKKEYERDVSLVVESLWAQKMRPSIEKRLSIVSPHKTFTAFFTTDENMQIWENEEAIQWYRDTLLEENKKGTAFVEGVLADYVPLLEQIKDFWAAGPIADIQKLTEYKKLVEAASELFSLWYYPVSDDRTPANVRELILPVRTADGFFGYNDAYVKGCVKALGGMSELALLVFPHEFPHIPNEQTLRDRAQGTVSIDGAQDQIISLKEFAALHPEYHFEGLNTTVDQIQEFKGQAAFKGKVTGPVRIVKNKFQMTEVKTGDVLVSPMTTPDFLPAMEKAAAFITDEGGIICHAAIVAREMKKPCIIGTKVATSVLKNGDVVEVDAEQGVVRVIETV